MKSNSSSFNYMQTIEVSRVPLCSVCYILLALGHALQFFTGYYKIELILIICAAFTISNMLAVVGSTCL